MRVVQQLTASSELSSSSGIGVLGSSGRGSVAPRKPAAASARVAPPRHTQACTPPPTAPSAHSHRSSASRRACSGVRAGGERSDGGAKVSARCGAGVSAARAMRARAPG